MIFAIVKMHVRQEKRKELLQTIHAMDKLMLKEKGCLSSGLCQDTENENLLCLVQEWEDQQDLDRYLRSDRFGALLGAKNLLREPPEIKFHVVSYTAGMEAVNAVRGKDVSN